MGPQAASLYRSKGHREKRTSYPGLLACLLAGLFMTGCQSLAGIDDRKDQLPKAKFGQFEQEGAIHDSETEPEEWINFVRMLYGGKFPQADQLPENHILPPETAERMFVAQKNANTLSWIGHASFVLRMDGATILTDPVVSEKIGEPPFEVKRIAPVTFDWRWLDRIDAVVVSHADYDHMDIPSLKQIIRQHPDVTIIVPERTARMLWQLPRANVMELGWFDDVEIAGTRITQVPSIHGSRRPPYLTDSSHWGGYVLQSRHSSVYFSGDTAAGTLFDEIPRRLGRVDLALVPGGAYEPREFEKGFHVNPDESVALAETVGARKAISHHWGTFALSQESGKQQKRDFLKASTARVSTKVMRIGETIRLH